MSSFSIICLLIGLTLLCPGRTFPSFLFFIFAIGSLFVFRFVLFCSNYFLVIPLHDDDETREASGASSGQLFPGSMSTRPSDARGE